MVTIALYNIKGGVGKTAGCVNLAYLAASDDKKVLIWDLDPQGSASFYLKARDTGKSGNIKKLLQGEIEPSGVIQETEFENFWIIPAEFNNRHLDVLVEETKQNKKKWRSLISKLGEEFDYLFIDCPPGIGPLSEAVFSVADMLVLPTIPTTLSIRTYDQLIAFFESKDWSTEKIYAFFNMADKRKNMHNDTIEAYKRNKQFFKQYIPYLSTVEKMGTHLTPVAWFAPSSYATHAFRELWKEIKKKLG